MNKDFNGDYVGLTQSPEDQMVTQTAGFLWRAMAYIIARRPHELATIAILNEKAYDLLDEMDGASRAKGIN